METYRREKLAPIEAEGMLAADVGVLRRLRRETSGLVRAFPSTRKEKVKRNNSLGKIADDSSSKQPLHLNRGDSKRPNNPADPLRSGYDVHGQPPESIISSPPGPNN